MVLKASVTVVLYDPTNLPVKGLEVVSAAGLGARVDAALSFDVGTDFLDGAGAGGVGAGAGAGAGVSESQAGAASSSDIVKFVYVLIQILETAGNSFAQMSNAVCGID